MKALLFEEFVNSGDEQINEAKGPSREILAIAKKIQFGTRAGIPKDVIIKGSVRNPGNEGDVDLEQWYSMLIQKFEGSGFMSSFEHTKGTITSYNTVQDFILGQFFKISIQAWSSGTILLELKQKMADTESELKKAITIIDKREEELGKQLSDKYGVGTVNIEAGTFTPRS